jgi:hypothetical protein
VQPKAAANGLNLPQEDNLSERAEECQRAGRGFVLFFTKFDGVDANYLMRNDLHSILTGRAVPILLQNSFGAIMLDEAEMAGFNGFLGDSTGTIQSLRRNRIATANGSARITPLYRT